MSESDGVEDAFEGQLRLGLLVAGRVAEELARMREQSARVAEQQSLQAARDLQDRAAAERTTARAALIPLERQGWWDRAQPADIEAAWQTARQWEAVEPDAARAAETIREQVHARYGIDVDALERDHRGGGPGEDLAGALDERAALEQRRATQATAEAERQRTQAAKEAAQETVVATLLGGDATDERATVDVTSSAAPGPAAVAGLTAAAPGYDSPQRRAATTSELHGRVGAEHGEAVEARMSADTANARPVTDVIQAGGRAGTQSGRSRRPLGRGRDQAHGVER